MVCATQLDLQLQTKYFPAMQYNVVMVESEEVALPRFGGQGVNA
jgi:hypothetical protein